MAEEQNLKTISNLYRHLLKTGLITADAFTEATLRNFIRGADLKFKGLEKKERRAFEMPHINMLWTADFMHKPYLTVGKRKIKICLCVIVEDHSRVPVGARFFTTESSLSLQITLKEAILTYGNPRKLYCDNAKVFSSGYLQLVCAGLGIALIHSKPYDSPSRGKVERVIRTVRLMFLPNICITVEYTLDDLNRDLKSWAANEYHQNIHASTGEKPIDRYINDMPNVKINKLTPYQVDDLFYQAIYRTVKNDCTVQISNKLYEVPATYIGMKFNLPPLGMEACRNYILHTLQKNNVRAEIFTDPAFKAVYNISRGVLRTIGSLVIKTLTYGASCKKQKLSEEDVFEASKEL